MTFNPNPEAPGAAFEAMADRLYDKPERPDREFYPLEKQIGTAVEENYRKLEERCRLTPEVQAAERRDLYAMARATQLDQEAGLVEHLHRVWTDARLAMARPGGDDEDLATQTGTLTEEAFRELRDRYRPEVHQLVDRTKRWATGHPLLAEILSTRTIGARLDVIEPLMQHVQRHGLGR